MASLFQRRRSKATQTERVRERRHEGFLRYANFRWAKISGGLCLLIIVSYALIDVTPRPNGGSWYGYTLGTIGAGLIDKELVTPAVIFGALIGAMFWNVVTWLKGIPSSSSRDA